MMKKILFIAATSGELKVIKQEIKKLNFQNMMINFLLLGIGNYSTILSLQESIVKQKYDFIVNIGVCGYSRQYTKLIQISRIKNIMNFKELIVPVCFKFAVLESIACSEKILYSFENMSGENFVDMESFGVELVCNKFQIPRMILKVPVDKVGEETKNFDFKKAKKLLAENIDYKKLVEEIGEYLKKNIVGLPLVGSMIQKYQNYYKMTFAEKLIFEKLYNKYLVLVEEEGGKKFDIFFEKNKLLSKKNFFKKLDDIKD